MIGYILDSDHLSLLQRGYEPLRIHLSSIPSEQIAITIVSVEELTRGRLAQIRRATEPQDRVTAYHWMVRTFGFLCKFKALAYDSEAEVYFQSFRARKIRIGTQDLKIASIALREQAILVTRNRRDFERVPNLHTVDWTME